MVEPPGAPPDDPDRICDVELGPLGHDDAVRLVSLLRPGLDQAATAALVARGGGVPFWLTELAVRAEADLPLAVQVAET